MKILLFIILILTSIFARENPFEPLFDTRVTKQKIIPLLHITTNDTFATQKEILPQKPTVIVTPDESLITSIIPVVASIPKEQKVAVIIEEEPVKIITKTNKKKKTKKKTKKKKPVQKKITYKTIYQNYFLKIQTNYKSFKIFTKDKLLKKVRYTNPQRVTFDFDRLQYFHTKNITFNKAFVQKIKLGSHHHFYRITVELKKYKRYKLIKKPYGYLLTFY